MGERGHSKEKGELEMKWMVFGIVFGLIETAWFGFNYEPCCRAEWWCDRISNGFVFYGFILVVIRCEVKKVRLKWEQKDWCGF